jgi:hypothetical protein
MAMIRRFTAASACAAAFSLLATPAAAVDLPQPARASAYGTAVYEGDMAEDRRWRRHRHRAGVDAGAVLAGVLILGTIAAVAGAAKRNREAERPAPYPAEPYRYRQGGYDAGGRGLDRAVDMCVDEIERGPDRVGAVDGANRTGEGWSVSGALEDGAGFTCRIDNAGRIRGIDIGGDRGAYEPAADNQYSDDVYARARIERGAAEPGVAPSGGEDDRPIWTGDNPDAAPEGDGRYDVSQTPDFEQGG